MTTTDLTIESLEFMSKLVENKPRFMKDPIKRKELMKNMSNTDFQLLIELFVNHENKNKSNKKHVAKGQGYVLDRLVLFLKENPGESFSTTDISKRLNIPQPTVRTYIRNLSEKDQKYKIIRGRPNYVKYIP